MTGLLIAKRQVFISYAHADNQPEDGQESGWVSLFVAGLKRAVARQAGGAAAEFWMDPRLEPQRSVDAELRQRIRESAVILAFMSPRYIESLWCTKEMATFIDEVGSGTAADRVFLVEVLRTDRNAWHQALHGLSAVQMWVSSLDRPEPKTMGWPEPDPKGDRGYWDELNQLAAVLGRQLAALAQVAGHATMEPGAQGTLVSSSPHEPAAPPPEPAADSPLSIVVHAADDEDPKLVMDTQVLLGDLDAYAYLAPRRGPGQTPAQHRAAVERQVRSSHGVLVVYGAAPPSWVQSTHENLLKLLARERRGTWAGLLEGPPELKVPHGLPPRGLMVLDCRTGPRKDELNRFVQVLREEHGLSSHV